VETCDRQLRIGGQLLFRRIAEVDIPLHLKHRRLLAMKGSRLALLLPLSIVIILNSCSDRDRNNPLDPKNPNTKGSPVGLQVLAKERDVSLFWEPINLEGIEAINVYRKSSLDSGFALIGQVKSGASTYSDDRVDYGVEYSYRITALAGEYESPPSKAVAVTPGPTYVWVADRSSGYIVRLTHDLKHHLFAFGVLNFPYLIAVSPRERAGWVFSLNSDTIYKLNSFGQVDVTLRGFSEVTDMAVDTSSLNLWVAQAERGTISRHLADGSAAFSTRDVSKPKALAVDSRRHRCVAIDDGSVKRLVSITATGQTRALPYTDFQAPNDLTLSQNGDAIWVADSTRVVKIDFFSSTAGITVGEFFWVSLIEFDNTRNVCWVVDLEPVGEPASLLKLDANGQILFKLNQFGNPRSIAVNEYDGSCLVADTGRAQVFRVTGDGGKIEIVGDFAAPYCVVVEHH